MTAHVETTAEGFDQFRTTATTPGASARSGHVLDAPPLFLVPDDLSALQAEGRAIRLSAANRARRYLEPFLAWLRVSDMLVVSSAVVIAQVMRFGLNPASLQGGPLLGEVGYTTVSAVIILAWMVSLHVQDSYDGRLVGHGVQEYRQVFAASMWLFGALAITSFAFKLDFARGYVLLAFPLGTVLLLLSRWFSRRWLVVQRRQGRLSDRVLLVGDREHVAPLVAALRRTPDAGYDVLGACVDDATGQKVAGVPVVGAERDVLVQSLRLGVDVVAVSSSAGLGATGLRKLGWALEGTNIDLVVAPGIMDVAGPRVLTRPVQGLPLLHVEAPTFAGPQLVVKSIIDRAGAMIALLVLSPLMLTVAALIALHDRGPVLFRQERVGRDGQAFQMLKFRSMVPDAEELLPTLALANDAAGPLFKLREDPRTTSLGRFIRRYSIDELPQLVNVLQGEMSLVGPRPPLPREVLEYEADARRRLLVKPGMTGMWQINGRSNLSWEDSVRLDLYYVENWTPLLDLQIMWRTSHVVLHPERHGAY